MSADVGHVTIERTYRSQDGMNFNYMISRNVAATCKNHQVR